VDSEQIGLDNEHIGLDNEQIGLDNEQGSLNIERKGLDSERIGLENEQGRLNIEWKGLNREQIGLDNEQGSANWQCGYSLEEQPNERNNCNFCSKNHSEADLVHSLTLPRGPGEQERSTILLVRHTEDEKYRERRR